VLLPPKKDKDEKGACNTRTKWNMFMNESMVIMSLQTKNVAYTIII